MPEPIGTSIFEVGEALRSTCTFKVDGKETDPTSVIFKFKTPDDTITIWEYGQGNNDISKLGTGQYRAVMPLEHPGSNYYRWEGTGAAKGAAERRIQVKPTQFA